MRFLTNKFGGGVDNTDHVEHTLEQLDARYVNTSENDIINRDLSIEGTLSIKKDLTVGGKVSASELKINGKKFLVEPDSDSEIEDGTETKNKPKETFISSFFGFVPKAIIKRYFEYSYIKDSFKPTFWISYHFNNGLGFTNDKVLNDILGDRTVQGLVDLTHKFTQSNGYIYKNKYGLHFDENSTITSQFPYSQQFTFFLLGKVLKDGKIFSNDKGTSILGWNENRKNVLYMGENSTDNSGIIDNRSISSYIEKPRDNNCQFYILSCDKNSKFIMNALNTGNPVFYNTTKGGNSWNGKVVIGGGAEGYIYEVLCFNYALDPDNINKIKDFLLSYYNNLLT